MTLTQKQNRARTLIRQLESVVVAFSGGADSALVLALAQQELGARALAVTARSPSVPQRELNSAAELAHALGARHRFVDTGEVDLPNYAKNPANRCFYCKSELYAHLAHVAGQEGLKHLVNGTNQDDLGDYRPGLESAKTFGVRSPLSESGMTKQDVRALSRKLEITTWDKPAMPCLASRIPYGQEVTREKLSRVEQAEAFLWSLGYRELRVRHWETNARIELPLSDLPGFLAGPDWPLAKQRLHALGFEQVEVDPEGFRSGKLNSVLPSP